MKNYANEVVTKVNEYIEGACIQEVTKNNGITKTGIQLPMDGGAVAPVVYIDDFYKANKPVDEAVEYIREIYEREKNNTEKDAFGALTKELVADFGKATPYILPRLTGVKPEIPCISYLDLFVTFYLRLNERATIQITQAILDCWKVTVDQLLDTAITNIESKCVTMQDLMAGLVEYVPEVTELDNPIPMYVLTNTDQFYGASAILKGDLKKFNQKFFVLPSSVHEWIFIPADSGEVEALTSMVQEINASCVDPEEVLSNHVYFWNGTELTIA